MYRCAEPAPGPGLDQSRGSCHPWTAELKLRELIIQSGKEEREEGAEGHTGFWHLWDRGEGGVADSASKKEEEQMREERLGIWC